jgi:hypothetical protein
MSNEQSTCRCQRSKADKGSSLWIAALPLASTRLDQQTSWHARIGSMSKHEPKPPGRMWTSNNRTSTAFLMNSGRCYNLRYPCRSTHIAWAGDDHVSPIAALPTRFSTFYEPGANGKPWTRPRCVRIQQPTIGSRYREKQESSAHCGK